MKIKNNTFLLLFISTLAFSQTNQKILLEWKIAKNDTLKYKTTMDAVRIESEEKKQKDSTANFLQEGLKSLADINSNLKYQTNLYVNNRNGKFIDIEMKLINEDSDKPKEDLKNLMSKMKNENQNSIKEKKKKKKSEDTEKDVDSLDLKNMFKGLASLNGNIVLRGRISNTGEIISKYYQNSQKNLIAVLFELPNRPVEIREKWKLNVNLIQMDQNFVCDSLDNTNSVYIEKIIDGNNERIAVIKYNISEFVSGDFNNPMGEIFGTETEKKTFMKMSHIATGNFSITKGKWVSYEGEMEIESNFMMLGGKSKTIYKLTE